MYKRQVDYYSGEPAKLSDLATEEGLERFREHRARFMDAAKRAVPPADPDRIAALERLESRLEVVQPVKLVPGQIACQLGSSSEDEINEILRLGDICQQELLRDPQVSSSNTFITLATLKEELNC